MYYFILLIKIRKIYFFNVLIIIFNRQVEIYKVSVFEGGLFEPLQLLDFKNSVGNTPGIFNIQTKRGKKGKCENMYTLENR